MFNSFSKMCIPSYFHFKKLIISIAQVNNLGEGKAYFKPPLFLLSCYFLISVSHQPFSIPERGHSLPGTWPCRCFTLCFQSWHSTEVDYQNIKEPAQTVHCWFHWLLLRHFCSAKMPQVSQNWAHTEAMPTGLHFPVIQVPQTPPASSPSAPQQLFLRKLAQEHPSLAKEGAQAATDTRLCGRDRWAWSGSGSEAELRQTQLPAHTRALPGYSLIQGIWLALALSVATRTDCF